MIDVIVDEELGENFNAPPEIEQAVLAACKAAGFAGLKPELCVRFATDYEVQVLNQQWRGKNKVTDVLSFPMQQGPEYDFEQSLGDIALALPFIQQQASRLHLSQSAHTMHLIVHATLHLLGYDHIDDDDAVEMQTLERKAMAALGLHDPYPTDESEMI